MTNFDKFKKELLFLLSAGDNYGVVEDAPQSCKEIKCAECKFKKNCYKLRKQWLDETYIPPNTSNGLQE